MEQNARTVSDLLTLGSRRSRAGVQVRTAATAPRMIAQNAARRARRLRHAVQTRFTDITINVLTGLGVGSAVAVVLWAIALGVTAYGGNIRLAGLFAWFAVIALVVSLVSFKTAYWLQIRQIAAEQPSLHANDLI